MTKGVTQAGEMITTTPLLPPTLAAAAESSDLEPEIPFVLGGEICCVDCSRYTKIAFVAFSCGYTLALLGSSSLSSFTGASTEEDAAALGEER